MTPFGIRRRLKSALGLGPSGPSPRDTVASTGFERSADAGPQPFPEAQPFPEVEPFPMDTGAGHTCACGSGGEHAAEEPVSTEAPVPTAAPVSAEDARPESSAPEDDTAGPPISLDAVQTVLDDMVRPALQGDGGDITLIGVEGADIHVRLVGACSTCPSSIMTMQLGVEALLREEFPMMRELVQVD